MDIRDDVAATAASRLILHPPRDKTLRDAIATALMVGWNFRGHNGTVLLKAMRSQLKRGRVSFSSDLLLQVFKYATPNQSLSLLLQSTYFEFPDDVFGRLFKRLFQSCRNDPWKTYLLADVLRAHVRNPQLAKKYETYLSHFLRHSSHKVRMLAYEPLGFVERPRPDDVRLMVKALSSRHQSVRCCAINAFQLHFYIHRNPPRYLSRLFARIGMRGKLNQLAATDPSSKGNAEIALKRFAQLKFG